MVSTREGGGANCTYHDSSCLGESSDGGLVESWHWESRRKKKGWVGEAGGCRVDKRWGRGPINSVNRFLCRPVSIFQHSRLSSPARHTEHALPKDLREPYDFWRPSPEPSTKSHSSATATRISHTRLPTLNLSRISASPTAQSRHSHLPKRAQFLSFDSTHCSLSAHILFGCAHAIRRYCGGIRKRELVTADKST